MMATGSERGQIKEARVRGAERKGMTRGGQEDCLMLRTLKSFRVVISFDLPSRNDGKAPKLCLIFMYIV